MTLRLTTALRYLLKSGDDIPVLQQAWEDMSTGKIKWYDVPVKNVIELCICEGGTKQGHKNEAGGFCCPHFGNTCGHHPEW